MAGTQDSGRWRRPRGRPPAASTLPARPRFGKIRFENPEKPPAAGSRRARAVPSSTPSLTPARGRSLALARGLGHDGVVLLPSLLDARVPFAGLGGAKTLVLLMIIALPLILVVGTWMKRSRSR